jgi:carbamoyl-phosphate synthase large subunit
VGSEGFDEKLDDLNSEISQETLTRELNVPGADRLWYIGDAFRAGLSVDDVFRSTHVDPWYLVQIEDLIREEHALKSAGKADIDQATLFRLKRKGFSDARLARLLSLSEVSLRKRRHDLDIRPVYKRVDTCAAEFAASTAYMYSTYEEECEAQPSNREKIVVIGGGPNRIGQGIEFDYC